MILILREIISVLMQYRWNLLLSCFILSWCLHWAWMMAVFIFSASVMNITSDRLAADGTLTPASSPPGREINIAAACIFKFTFAFLLLKCFEFNLLNCSWKFEMLTLQNKRWLTNMNIWSITEYWSWDWWVYHLFCTYLFPLKLWTDDGTR